MINNALYKSCLFLTGGSVEKQAGTTSLEKLGGLWLKMPITFVCFFVAAISISGVPPFNGFFSKEMVYRGALERGTIFYLAAVLGSFFTAASFLKLGHAAFLGKAGVASKDVKEVPWSMLVPMIVIASICIFFGVYNRFPLSNFIEPVLGRQMPIEHSSADNKTLVVITVLVLAAAFLHHLLAARVMGGGYKALNHIRNAPVLRGIYNGAEKRFFDPYDIVLRIINGVSKAFWLADRAIDKFYDSVSVRSAYMLGNGIRAAHTGNYSLYVVWSLVGTILALIMLLK
jgi:NADH-quinone oxidoreductase subunit L